ncbi:MAG: hypothetical protein WAW96_18240 [Alphaproteobacteria bacterium]
MLTAIASLYVIAAFAPLLVRVFRSATGPVLASVPAFLLAWLLQFVPAAAQGRPWRFAFPWGGPGGVEAVFSLDALALLFALMIALLAIAALLASAGLTLSVPARGRLLSAMLALMSSGLGFVLADTPVLVMGFSVLATLSVFLLLTARRGAIARAQRIPLLVALLVGDLLLIVALAGLFVGSGFIGLSDLTSHALPGTRAAQFAAVILVVSGLLRLVLIPAGLRAPRAAMTSEAPIMLAQAGAYVPLALYIVLRFAPAFETATLIRLALGVAGAGLLVTGAISGLHARRLRTLIGSLTPLFFGLAFIHLAAFGPRGVSAGVALALAHGFGLGLLLVVSQLVSRGDYWINLDALKAATQNRRVALGLFGAGILALVGLLPSISMLALAQSLGAGTVPHYNPAEIAFSIAGHAVIVALMLLLARNLWKSSGSAPVSESSVHIAPFAGAFLVLALLLVPGWFPFVLDRLFVAAIVARGGAPVSLGPFWPQGIAIAFAVAALAIGAGLAWFDTQVKAALDWCAPAIPRRPERAWRRFLTQIAAGAGLAARMVERIGYRPIAPALAAVIAIIFVWIAIKVFAGPMPVFAVNILPLGALAASAAVAALLAVLQPGSERLVAVLSMASLLAALVLLAARVADLAYLLILVLVLETAILLVLAPRMQGETRQLAHPRMGQAFRIALALTCGAGAALTPIAVSRLSLSPMNWTKFDQIELWSALLAILLILGIVVSDLGRRRAGQS